MTTDALKAFASLFTPPVVPDGGATRFCIPSLTGCADAFLALTLLGESPRIVLAVTPGQPDADRLAEDLLLLTGDKALGASAYATRILEFPPPLGDDKSALGTRLKTIAALKAWALNPYPCVVVTSYPALSAPIARSIETIRLCGPSTAAAAPVGPSYADLCDKLAAFGYARLPQVEKEGDYSVRGGIVDVWSPGEEFPVRAEFFGDDLESLRTFNPASQTSIERIDFAEVMPVREGGVEVEGEGGGEVEGEEGGEVEGEVEGGVEGGGEPRDCSLFDLLPPDFSVLALEHNSYDLSALITNHQSPIANHQVPSSKLQAPSSKLPTLSSKLQALSSQLQALSSKLQAPSSQLQALSSQLQAPITIYTGDPAPRGVPTYDFQTSPLPGFSELGADEAHHPELFDTARKRLEQHIASSEKRGALILRLDDLSGGFELSGKVKPPGEGEQRNGKSSIVHLDPSPSPDLIVVTKSDRVFAKRVRHRAPNAGRQALGARLTDFDDLEPGEYVVHVDYGVGRYLGSSEIVVDGRRSEVFTIEYADGGKLHVPTAHAHLLSRYVGVKGETVRLHRLDGRRWEKDKRDAQKAVSDLAAALLETQARRETVPGFAYDVNCEGLDAFEAAFPYEETPDQAAAIASVKQDLAARKPMDRLICGDAGYGKTEVAMRAAFIAAMNGRQVAVLAPTTVLAEQHFETFTSRFDGTPIRIESCSRFQTSGTHEGTFRRLATGVCDIVIGTHAILSPKVCFRDLGLIIIDEEQRFGVRHKEFLKRLRATADVLTLSATPIPRTLYLSMTGARDLSLLRSPPRERVAVDTRIVRDSDEVIRTAIESEILRGGQVYFLHNRVADIGRVEKRLLALLEKVKDKGEGEQRNCRTSTVHLDPSPSPSPSTPSSTSTSTSTIRGLPRIVVAHGQMDSHTLAQKMRAFERGEFDILLSTTIIESGIDIPRANTILIDQADTFGMADLYQLRGRVGRSARQGYAYFLLPPSGDVDSETRERLTALKRHGGLGAGFNLAVRDLELRGAGNLLGSQQSGHIAAVGFGLYCQLLRRTIAILKGEKVQEVIDVKLSLDFASPRLPYEYIEEDVQRLSLMKRFAEAQDLRVVKALAAEMRDRFGPLPPEAREYVRIAELRTACAMARIDRVDVKETRAVFYKIGSRDIAFVSTLRGKTADAKLGELIRTMRSR